MIEKIKLIFQEIYFKIIIKIFLFYFKKIAKGKVVGLENLLSINHYILVINHVSYLDWLVLYSYFKCELNIHITFLAKEKLFSHFFWSSLMKKGKCIYVPQKFNFQNFKEMIKKIKITNSVIGIFPEGTRSYNGQMQEFKVGVINIAKMTNRQIIPIALKGFYEVWPRYKILPKFINIKNNDISINIGKPIFLSKELKEIEATKIIRNKIQKMLDDA